ncbi:uncharacterized protein SAPINGB_P002062 [Magnusiomyces paraingens]|uniref:Major facilitator superfamily (MFS) profile domain-containing protein n=1 Tax=Magnusiomyces paraingens TaxID=2606893 RepID=A0A5E8BE78_9ASCO|nr:uncharacterized protein SAPINGB_P002062 [Saprochaete ingens]VVT49015.1 unnamed protein product [Saprochaete ingens]
MENNTSNNSNSIQPQPPRNANDIDLERNLTASSSEEGIHPYEKDSHDEDLNIKKTRSINHFGDHDSIHSEIDVAFEDPEYEEQLSKIVTHIDPKHLEVNEKDPWKYTIDAETGYRIVEWVEDDPDCPLNWSNSKKWFQTANLGLICFVVAFSSAVVTGDMEGPMERFGVSMEVVILTVTLLVLGFGVGPLVFAPFSEEWGRQIIYNTTLFVAVIFIVPCAVAKNIGTLLVFRLLGGITFSAPMTLIGGSLSDMWRANERGIAMAIFSAMPFLGPVTGPLIGGYIGQYAGWRWIYYVLLIFSGCVYAYVLVAIPETHHATLLKRRCKKLIKETGDDSYRTRKMMLPMQLGKTMVIALIRPFQLFCELIVFLMTIYMTILYCLLYIFFFAYPIVFGEGKGWSTGKTGLTFIPIAVGSIVGTAIAPWINNDYIRRAKVYTDRGEMPPPEIRLIPMMFGSWLMPIGLFIFAWTSYPSLIWVGPVLAGFPCGIGFLIIYNSANNYIVDSYQHFAASALAAKTSVRSFGGATVILGTVQMYHAMGYQWASSLLAFVSLGCCGIPFLFYFFGAKIRAKSKYAYNPE